LYNGGIPREKDRPVTHRAPINPPPAGGATIPTCIYGGFMVSAVTLGFVIQRMGYTAGFAVAGLSCAVATAGVAGLLKRGR
jgi:hypothetical protein